MIEKIVNGLVKGVFAATLLACVASIPIALYAVYEKEHSGRELGQVLTDFTRSFGRDNKLETTAQAPKKNLFSYKGCNVLPFMGVAPYKDTPCGFCTLPGIYEVSFPDVRFEDIPECPSGYDWMTALKQWRQQND